MRRLLDANAILRYVLCDNERQAQTVREVVEEGAFTAPEIVFECVFVLTGSVYGFSREEVADAMAKVLDDIDCEHEATVRRALELFHTKSLDFVDCMLAARAEVEGAEVFTFDKKLNRSIGQLGAED